MVADQVRALALESDESAQRIGEEPRSAGGYIGGPITVLKEAMDVESQPALRGYLRIGENSATKFVGGWE